MLPAVLALVAVLAACGDTSTSSEAATETTNDTAAAGRAATAWVTVPVYLLGEDGRLVAVPRQVEGDAVARAAVAALIEGPTAADTRGGLSSDVPAETELLGIDVAGDTATVDVSPTFVSFSDATTMRTRTAQVVFTVLDQFATVTTVHIVLDGAPAPSMPPVGKADFADLAPSA